MCWNIPIKTSRVIPIEKYKAVFQNIKGTCASGFRLRLARATNPSVVWISSQSLRFLQWFKHSKKWEWSILLLYGYEPWPISLSVQCQVGFHDRVVPPLSRSDHWGWSEDWLGICWAVFVSDADGSLIANSTSTEGNLKPSSFNG